MWWRCDCLCNVSPVELVLLIAHHIYHTLVALHDPYQVLQVIGDPLYLFSILLFFHHDFLIHDISELPLQSVAEHEIVSETAIDGALHSFELLMYLRVELTRAVDIYIISRYQAIQ